MNMYVSLINNTINFIEENIYEKMSLEDISRQFCVSEFHFNRMFRTVAGRTLKQYILGRKLTRALERLSTTDETVIDIAYDFGFEYPEVFSRAFKKQFGVSPNIYRKDKPRLEPVNIASVVERDIVSYQGSMTLKGSSILLEDIYLKGIQIEVDLNKTGFEQVLQSSGDDFLMESQRCNWLNKERFFTVVNCHGDDDNGEYTVFYGMETEVPIQAESLKTRLIPGGWYEKFIYIGDMYDIRETFIDDLYRWVMVKEIELNYNGIGMINIFQKDYQDTHEVQILVPIKIPK